MSKKPKTSRRDFLKTSAGAALAGTAAGSAADCTKKDEKKKGAGAKEDPPVQPKPPEPLPRPAGAAPAPKPPMPHKPQVKGKVKNPRPPGGVGKPAVGGKVRATSQHPRPPGTQPAGDQGHGPHGKSTRPRKTGRAKVVLIRDDAALDDRGRPRAKVLAKMLDDAVVSLTGGATVKAAWGQLLKPTDKLGIKTNVWRYLSTPPGLENAIGRRAKEQGIPAAEIKMDDRKALSTLGDRTALINARPLRSHHWAGIGGCIKNYIMFVEKPQAYHDDACADLAAVWNLPIVAGKTRLNILVMLTPLYHGRGPHHFNSRYTWQYKGLIVSKDPVAADKVGVEILRAKRGEAFGAERPFAIRTHHVDYADSRHGLGIADLKRIDVTTLGPAAGRLWPPKA